MVHREIRTTDGFPNVPHGLQRFSDPRPATKADLHPHLLERGPPDLQRVC